ncbi:hypothetical protein [Lysobacter terrae]
MTTRPDHHEPLDAEERDLAARLRRAGPLDGPSPALDAKILAAAHAAAATHKPRRHGRLAWLGLPPALVTGVGVAAAAVLALGLVWQLRPQYGPAMQGDAAPASADEEVIIFAEPAATPRAQANNPPPLPAPPIPNAASEARASRIAEDDAAAAQARANAAASAKAAVDDRQKDEVEAAAVAQSTAQAAQAADTAAPEAFSYDETAAAPPADAAAAAGLARKSHATYTTAARATAERRERERSMADMAPAAAPAAPPMANAAPPVESTTLDRIEVTGSRIKRGDVDWSQVPVSEDKRLPAAEWLERIRTRRDEDDLDNARASLKLFRRDYPRIRIPDDLRALLATDAKQ